MASWITSAAWATWCEGFSEVHSAPEKFYPARLCLMIDMPLVGVELINLGFNLIEHVNSPVGESLESEAHMCSVLVTG